ncbi:MAG: class I SAM-dependent methyltransferase [Ruminococcus sp.]|nr:class I SAM-dependent methyltransferase [Ruminococcus sp.]
MKLFSAVKEKKLAKAQLRCIEKFAVPGDSDRILDINDGSEDIPVMLSGGRKKFYSINISPEEEAASFEQLSFSGRGRAEELPYNDNMFDLVCSAGTLDLWEDRDKALREILRVLAEGGSFVMTAEISEEEARELRRDAREAGFKQVAVKVIEKDRAYCLISEKE